MIYLDITWFISTERDVKNTVSCLQKQVIEELCSVYPDIEKENSLPIVLAKIAERTGRRFIVIIDEWDALFREAKEDIELQKEYLQLLRGLFKSSLTDKMIEAAYMTGILPMRSVGMMVIHLAEKNPYIVRILLCRRSAMKSLVIIGRKQKLMNH